MSIKIILASAAFALAACSAEPQSFPDYLANLCATRLQPASPKEAAFLKENAEAMETMMFDMTVRPSGDIDADFVGMMTAHHKGAIVMAMTELRHGSNETLRRMAQEIIVTQQQEIAAMRLALNSRTTASAASHLSLTEPGGTARPLPSETNRRF